MWIIVVIAIVGTAAVLGLALVYRAVRMSARPSVELVSEGGGERARAIAERLGLTVGGVADVCWGPDYVEEVIWLTGPATSWAELGGTHLTWLARGRDGTTWLTVPATRRGLLSMAVLFAVIPDVPTWKRLGTAGGLEAGRAVHEARIAGAAPAPAQLGEWLEDLERRATANAEHCVRSRVWELVPGDLRRPTWPGALRMALLAPVSLMSRGAKVG